MSRNWRVVPFGEVCEISGGSQPPKKDFIYQQKNGYVRLIQVRDYRTDNFITYIPKEKAKKFCDATDIMIGRYGPPIFGIFSGLAGAYNVALMKAIPNEKIVSKEYFRWFLKTDDLIRFVEKTSKRAAGQDGVRKERLYSYPVPIPPLEEQQQIVAILDQAFEAIDQAKANIEKNIENAKELFQSKLNAIFSQRGEGWKEITLGEIGKVSMCKRILKRQTSTNGDIPFYKIGTFGKQPDAFIAKEIYNEFKSKYSFPKKGDILISASGTIGRRVIYDGKPAYFQDSNIVWIDNNEELITNNYLYQFYGVCDWNPSKGATISRLYNDDLRKIKISFPSIAEQRKMVPKMEDLNRLTTEIESKYSRKLNELEDIKKSILQKAFDGELTGKNEETLSPEQKHALLIAWSYSAHRNANTELTFGHTKSEKMVHLFENYAEIDLNRNPTKDAAGPNDFNKVIHVVEPLAKKEKYFSVTKEAERYTYGFASNTFKGITKLKTQLTEKQKTKAQEVINLFLDKKMLDSELIATVYAAWNNLLIKKDLITDEAIVYEARENWHDKKLDIERHKFFETIELLRANNIVPTGMGKLVEKKTLF